MKTPLEILRDKFSNSFVGLSKIQYDMAVECMKEYAQQQLKNCNLQNVSNNEVAVCDCHKGKFVFNEVKQELICGCGRRIKITN